MEVPAGHFSFVDNKVSGGMPRGATRVGLTSYTSMKSIFLENERIKMKSFDKAFSVDQVLQSRRSIASVPNSIDKQNIFDDKERRRGKIIFFGKSDKMKRFPASVSGPMKYYESMKNKGKKTENVRVRFFEVDTFSQVPTSSISQERKVQVAKAKMLLEKERLELQRIREASVARDIIRAKKSAALLRKLKQRSPSSADPYSKKHSEFEKSLRDSEMNNKRHTDERNSLIDELESYSKTYKKRY